MNDNVRVTSRQAGRSPAVDLVEKRSQTHLKAFIDEQSNCTYEETFGLQQSRT